MDRKETLAATGPLLRRRLLRMLLIAAPGITAAVAIVTATESNLALVIVLNAATGIVISSVLFIAVSIAARQVADERVKLVESVEQGFWRSRAQQLSIHEEESTLYTDWYVRLRLQEEIERSQQHNLQLSVLVIKPVGLHQEGDLSDAISWFGDQIRPHLRRADLLGLLQDGNLAVVMPLTKRRTAQTVQRRIISELASVDAWVGCACFPEDAQAPTTLLAAASNVAVSRSKQHVA